MWVQFSLTKKGVDYLFDPDLLKLNRSKRRAKTDGHQTTKQELLLRTADDEQKKIIACAQRSSHIFTTVPLEKLNLSFESKQDFRDLLRLRYKKPIANLPTTCVCGSHFSEHSQICKVGGFITMRHNEIRDLFGNLTRKYVQ